MKLHQILYLIREGFRNTWQNRLMALASVGVLVCCLMLTGFSYLIYVNVEQMFQNAYEQNVVAVYLDTDLTDAQVTQVGTTLRGIDNIKDIEFLSKEEFLAQYGGALEEDVLSSFEGDNNPLPDTYIISMHDLSLFRDTLDRIEAIAGVEEASYDADTAEVLTRVRSVVLAIGSGIIAVLLVVSLFIIVNTIKLTVHNRREEIYIMKSVGATDSYVRFPFVVEGLILGVVSGGVGYGLIALVYQAITDNLTFDNPLLKLVPFSDRWGVLLFGFLVGGMLVGVCGSAISMSKYLKQEGSLRL
ncbi:MAG: permease-like cell division protein FtsX [Clostridia bacterium]|nr:permease-like cell division protein FtsX [Clostridia bacterium]